MQNVTHAGRAKSSVTNSIAGEQKSTRAGAAGAECDVLHRDRALAEIAARRRGIVTNGDLAAVGLGRGAVARRIAAGRLRPLHRGVYVLGPVLAPGARELAAVLGCGDAAVLSHHAAAALWGIRPPTTGDVDVTVTRQLRPRAGVRIHRARAVEEAEIQRLVRRDLLETPRGRRGAAALRRVLDRCTGPTSPRTSRCSRSSSASRCCSSASASSCSRST
jgi:hypothetical protein